MFWVTVFVSILSQREKLLNYECSVVLFLVFKTNAVYWLKSVQCCLKTNQVALTNRFHFYLFNSVFLRDLPSELIANSEHQRLNMKNECTSFLLKNITSWNHLPPGPNDFLFPFSIKCTCVKSTHQKSI